MMALYFRYFLMYLALSLLCSACKKDKTEEKLVQTGIVSFQVNGAPWNSNLRDKMVILGDDSLRHSVGAHMVGPDLTLIAISTRYGDTSVLYIHSRLNSAGTGVYHMTGSTFNVYWLFGKYFMEQLPLYALAFNTRSTLSVTKFDPSGHKISGTFNTTHKSISGEDSVVLSNGKFEDVYLD